jgi:hypothetical protein
VGYSIIRLCRALAIGFYGCALMAQGEAPAPTTCTAQDASFVNTFHVLVVCAAALAAFLGFYVIPRTLQFKWWWLTRSHSRFLISFTVLFVLSTALSLLPWLEAAHGLGIGFSTLPVFQVDYRYLECRGVDFSHQTYLWGDFYRASTDPGIYLVVFQSITIVIAFLFAGAGVFFVHHLLVRRSIAASAARLGGES